MNKKYLSVAILFAGVLFASVVLAQTSTPPVPPTNEKIDASGITYPIPELGNCTDRDNCRSYCNDPANMAACIDFASKHGLMNNDEASVAKKFAGEIRDKQTPGGCTSPESCNAYCQDVSHLDQCLSFAKGHGISDDNTKQGEQVQKFLAQGGKLPGGCASKDSCEAYCSDFNNATECTAFAKGAGFLKKIASDQGMSEDQLQKVLDLTSSGQAPGGCKSKDQCESYCKDNSHLQECLSFGTKAGFISEDQAKKIQEIGGKGPGGCDSEAACRTYCNDPKNSQACFQFGKDHNLIPADELQKAQDGIVQLKAGLEKAPPEVQACINSVLGADAIAQIQAGTFVPSPDIADRLQECAGKFKSNFTAGDAFKGAPPAVAQCLKDKLGDTATKVLSGQTAPDASTADAFRVCMGQSQIMQGGASGQGMPNVDQFLNGAPPEVQACIKDKLGSDFADKLSKGGVDTSKIKDCFQNFRPSFKQNGQGELSGSSGGGGEQHNGFTECGITNGAAAAFVCGTNGNSRGTPTGAGVETTYFNECHAKQQGAQILHTGVCVRDGKPDVPCSDIAHPVCGTDGNSWTSECNAKEAGAGVKHEGVCTNEDRGQNGAGGSGSNKNLQGNGAGENGQGYGSPSGSVPSNMMQGLPANVPDCVKGKLSSDEYAKFSQGQVSSDAQDAIKSCYSSSYGPPQGMMPQIPKSGEGENSYGAPPSGSVPSYGPPSGAAPQGYGPPAGMMPQGYGPQQ
jgi:hypothetical protein